MKTIKSIMCTVCRVISISSIAFVIWKAVRYFRMNSKKTQTMVYEPIRAAAEKLEKTASALQDWADELKHNTKKSGE